MTKTEKEMAVRIGTRAAIAVSKGATHLDAITTQMQASGIDPWEPAYNEVGHEALLTLLQQVPVWKGPASKGEGHTRGWLEFVADGKPSVLGAPGDDNDDGEEGEKAEED